MFEYSVYHVTFQKSFFIGHYFSDKCIVFNDVDITLLVPAKVLIKSELLQNN